VSVLDKTWEWILSYGGVGVTLVDPVETILQRLSVPYLAAARAMAAEELQAILRRRAELVPVFFHPWKNNWFPDLDPSISELVPGFDRSAPFTGVGWLAQGVDEEGLIVSRESPYILPDRGHALCVRLLERTPRLSLCGGGRWSWPANASTDSETQLAALLADNDVDFTDWIIDAERRAPRRPFGIEPDVPRTGATPTRSETNSPPPRASTARPAAGCSAPVS
jgi:hypothetical protein